MPACARKEGGCNAPPFFSSLKAAFRKLVAQFIAFDSKDRIIDLAMHG